MPETTVQPVVKEIKYVKQEVPDPPPMPEYYSVIWGKAGDLYTLDEINAKTLLMNHELDRGYQEELRTIIINLKGK
jgi:hypothetical protein